MNVFTLENIVFDPSKNHVKYEKVSTGKHPGYGERGRFFSREVLDISADFQTMQGYDEPYRHTLKYTKTGTSGTHVAGRPESGIGAAPTRPPLRNGSTGAETQIMGGAYGSQFTDTAPDGGVLIGFEVGLGKWGANDVVHAVRPIFRSADGKESFGKQHGTDTSRLVVVKAKSGYAVGAITAKSMALLDGFSVTFMKVGKDALDVKDSYQSDWVGGKGGGPETVLAGDGKPIVGIIGRENGQLCTGMGLLRKL